MDWKKLLGYGVLFWLIMFIIATIFVGFQVGDALWVQILMWVITVIVVWILAPKVGYKNATGALLVGLGFVVIGLILDAIVTTRFTGWEYFTGWSIWVSYALVLLVPPVQASMKK